MQHPDVTVLHERLSEPFLAKHFPEKHALVVEDRRANNGPPGIACYANAMDLLREPPVPPLRLQFSKEIAYFADFDCINSAWLSQFKHVFLVRDPLAVMRSLYRVSQSGGTTYFDPDESGFDELARIHDLVLANCDPSQVLYLDSDADVMSDTRGTLARFCKFAGIDFSPRLLRWKPEKIEQWQFFRGWHDDAERSCGFRQVSHPEVTFPEAVDITALNKQSIYRFFQLAAAWQRATPATDHLNCLNEPEATKVRILLLASTPAEHQRAFQWAARLPADYAIWLCSDPKQCHFQAIIREVEQLLDVPWVSLTTSDDSVAFELSRSLGHLQLCSICPDSRQAQQSDVALIAVDGNNPTMSEVPSKIAQHWYAAIRQSHVKQMETQRVNASAYVQISSWHDHLDTLVRDAPDSIVAASPEGSLSARELYAQAHIFAVRLLELSPRGGWIAIRLNKDLRTLVTMTACSLLRWPYLDIPRWYGAEATASVLEKLNPVAVVGDAHTLDPLDSRYLKLFFEDLPQYSNEVPKVKPVPFGDIAYGLLTSGTTGTPKVVQITDQGRLDSLAFWQRHIRPGDRIGFNAWMTGYVYYPIFSGAVACLIPDDLVLDPQALSQYIHSNRLSQVMITPSLLAGLLQDDQSFQRAFATVHTLWLSGEQLPEATREQVGRSLAQCRIVDLYGSNEAGDVAVVGIGGHLNFTPGTEAYVLDSAQECARLGMFGELYVHTPGLTPGYLDDERADRAAFIENPLAQTCPDLAPRLLRTGDIVRLGYDGGIHLLGRSTTHLKLRGFKVFTSEVERVLVAHSEVRQALVTTRGDGLDVQLVAFVTVADSENPPNATALRQWASKQLPTFSVPVAYFLTPSIPAGGSQKRLSVRELLQMPLRSLPDNKMPLTTLQSRVAALWGDCLDLEGVTIGPDTDFLDIGGSLLLLELMIVINQAFGLKLSVADITRDTTLSGITRLIAFWLNGQEIEAPPFSVDFETEHYLSKLQTAKTNVRPRDGRRTILLTGATGYLGRMVVRQLRQTPGVDRIVCLVRADNAAHAEKRISDLGEVDAVIADLSQPRLGLSPDTYQRLSLDVDCIIHCGAEVNWLKRYDSLAGINVGGLVEILRLAAEGGAGVVFASTLAEPVPSTGYNQTKLVAERVAMAFCERSGIDLTILRCGDISAPTQANESDRINPDDYIGLMISSCLVLKAWPAESAWSLNLTPVDYVAQIFVHCALSKPTTHSAPIHHLYNPTSTAWLQVCTWMQTLVGTTQFTAVSFAEWHARLEAQAPGNAVLQRTLLILPMIIDDFKNFSHPAPLQFAQHKCPEIDAEWTQQYLSALQLHTGET